MSTSHGEDKRITVNSHYVPRAGKTLCLWRLVALFVKALLTSANHGQNLLGRDVNFANRVVLRVAKVDEVLILTEDMAHALRVMELGLVIQTVHKANLSVSNLILKLHRIFIY